MVLNNFAYNSVKIRGGGGQAPPHVRPPMTPYFQRPWDGAIPDDYCAASSFESSSTDHLFESSIFPPLSTSPLILILTMESTNYWICILSIWMYEILKISFHCQKVKINSRLWRSIFVVYKTMKQITIQSFHIRLSTNKIKSIVVAPLN